MRVAIMLLIPTLLVLPADVTAQVPLRPGERVRLTVPALCMRKHVVRFVRQNRDTLTVQADSMLTLPFAMVTRLDVRRDRSKVPVIAGVGVGVVLGAVVGHAVADTGNCPGGIVDFCPAEQTAGAIVGGAIIGGLAGGLLGLAIPVSSWREVPLDRLRVQPVATLDGRLGLAVSVSF